MVYRLLQYFTEARDIYSCWAESLIIPHRVAFPLHQRHVFFAIDNDDTIIWLPVSLSVLPLSQSDNSALCVMCQPPTASAKVILCFSFSRDAYMYLTNHATELDDVRGGRSIPLQLLNKVRQLC